MKYMDRNAHAINGLLMQLIVNNYPLQKYKFEPLCTI